MNRPPTGPDRWTFAGHTDFDDHIHRSIPGYTETHTIIQEAATAVLRPGDHVYDLGCSTGLLAAQIADQHPQVTVDAIDNEPDMTHTVHGPANLTVTLGDIRTHTYQPCRLIIAAWTIQFLPQPDRLPLLTRLHATLEPGGLLLLAEKTQPRHSRTTDLMTGLYTDHKLAAGFTPTEVLTKAASLRGVLEPWTRDQTEQALTTAGFTDHEPIQQHLHFTLWAAIR